MMELFCLSYWDLLIVVLPYGLILASHFESVTYDVAFLIFAFAEVGGLLTVRGWFKQISM